MTRISPSRLAVAAAVATGAFQLGGIVYAADYAAALTAAPTKYEGKCPAVIKFQGKITARRPGPVKYKFIRSDGALAPVNTLVFAQPGSKTVQTTWTLGGPALPNYSGWEAIEILAPEKVVSNKAEFSVRCAARPARKPDLVIRKWAFSLGSKCAPKNPIFIAQVTVGNVGAAPSPAISDKALVQVLHTSGNGWGNGIGLPAIPPGGSSTVNIPVYYLEANPGFMTSAAPHPFQAKADPLHLVDESNEGNNLGAILKIDPRRLCK